MIIPAIRNANFLYYAPIVRNTPIQKDREQEALDERPIS
jgi:hypothetical protein